MTAKKTLPKPGTPEFERMALVFGRRVLDCDVERYCDLPPRMREGMERAGYAAIARPIIILLWTDGLSYGQIARRCGYTRKGVQAMMKAKK